MSRSNIAMTVLVVLLAASAGVRAGVITTTLGNNSPGFNDGDTPTLLELIAAQSGQPAPFDAGKGNELFANLSESWTFNYGAVGDPILSASIILGIADHDSAASGSQLGLFSVDGTAVTGALDAAFEAGGGATDGQYGEYTLNLGAGLFADLVDGSATVNLDLQGPGLQTALFGGGVSESNFNGAFLIFSTLEITTRDATPAPEPGSLLLMAMGLGALSWRRRRPVANPFRGTDA